MHNCFEKKTFEIYQTVKSIVEFMFNNSFFDIKEAN